MLRPGHRLRLPGGRLRLRPHQWRRAESGGEPGVGPRWREGPAGGGFGGKKQGGKTKSWITWCEVLVFLFFGIWRKSFFEETFFFLCF